MVRSTTRSSRNPMDNSARASVVDARLLRRTGNVLQRKADAHPSTSARRSVEDAPHDDDERSSVTLASLRTWRTEENKLVLVVCFHECPRPFVGLDLVFVRAPFKGAHHRAQTEGAPRYVNPWRPVPPIGGQTVTTLRHDSRTFACLGVSFLHTADGHIQGREKR
jgi:hypothetical protein